MEEPLDIDLETIEELARLSQQHGLTELTVEADGYSVQLIREPASRESADADGPDLHSFAVAQPMEPAQVGEPIMSPTVGVFYRSPSPDLPAYVKEGDTIEEGQVIGLIEAMKTFNEITSPMAGRIHQITATNGALVNAGDPLMYVERDETQ